VLQRELHAASQVIGLGRARAPLGQLVQHRQRMVRLAGLQGRIGLGELLLWPSAEAKIAVPAASTMAASTLTAQPLPGYPPARAVR